jgi:pyrroline-5-carboxylate reductase
MQVTFKVGFIGGGAMGEAIISGLINAGIISHEALSASDINNKRLDYLTQNYKISTYYDNGKLLEENQVIILALKPQMVSEVLFPIKENFTRDKLVISLAAGISINYLYKFIPQDVGVVRVMSNMPALIGKGVSGVAFSENVSGEQRELTVKILEAVGKVYILPEKLLNAVTGLSGSGPAYVYLIIEALTDAGVRVGIPRDIAGELALNTVIGAAEMIKETEIHPVLLKDKVVTPAGTTIAGLYALEKSGIRAAFMDAVMAATERSRELGSD